MRALLLLFSLLAVGCGVKTAGYVAADGRAFAQAQKYPGQARDDGVSLVAEPEVSLESDDQERTATIRPFYRLDPLDDRRSHADLRQGDARIRADWFEASGGVGQISWGVLESYRPTDAIGQMDFVEGPSSTARLGQPYAEVGVIGEKTSLRLYYLPYLRERTFPGLRGRLRFPTLTDVDDPSFETRARQWQPTGAARFVTSTGDFDLGIGLFSGLGREPRFVAELLTGQVQPRYDLMHQASADAQYTIGPFVLKAEGFVRAWSKDLRVFGGGGFGADYTLFKLLGDADLSFAAEMLLDSRPLGAPFTFFEHDAFGGLRLAFNDPSSTEITGGAIVDVVDGTTFARLEIGRRFGDHWRASIDGNGFLSPGGKLESSFVKDDYARVRIAYFF